MATAAPLGPGLLGHVLPFDDGRQCLPGFLWILLGEKN